MQRPLIITTIALVVLGIGVAAYFYFFTGSADIAVAPEGSTTLPIVEQGAPFTGTTSATSSPQVTAPAIISARLVRISAGPVVPGAVVTNKAASASSSPETTVTYIERQSGNIFSYLTRAKTLTRISNKTVPGIQSAIWIPNAALALVRYLSGTDFSTVNTYALPANGSNGFFLPQNLADVAVSSNNILMLTSGVNGSTASLAH